MRAPAPVQVERLGVVLARCGYAPVGHAELLESYSNDAWAFEDVVVRVGWRGDVTRLEREATVVSALPGSVPTVEVVAAGHADGLGWTITRRARGQVLADAWPTLDAPDRRRAVSELAEALRQLHSWTPSDAALAALTASTHDDGTTEWITGRDVNPLPVERALRLVEAAKKVPLVDAGLIDAVGERLRELAADDPCADPVGVVVHGDAHFANIIWDDGLSALLDFEWARRGPTELELEPFLRPVDDGSSEARHEAEQVLDWLRTDYPELFAHPRIVERVWISWLAYSLRHTIVWPPDRAEADLPPAHPLLRLRRLVHSADPIVRILSR